MLPNLEECLSDFVLALENEREGLWQASWAILRAVQAQDTYLATNGPQNGSNAFSAHQPLFGAFAQAGGCTRARVAQLYHVALAFPEPGLVHQDKSHSWHRKVAQRARVLCVTPLELAREAIAQGWGQRELNAVRQIGDALEASVHPVRLKATCGECNARVSIISEIGCGWVMACPVCIARAAADGKSPPLSQLGRLA